MPLSTTSAYEEPSGLIVSPNSQVHVKLDRFKTDQFYSIYGNQALSMTGGTSYNTALKTIALPYTIDDTIGHVDYFGDFIVYTENGITFYITNTNTSETKTLICEDDLLSLESNDITTLRVKKYTLAGELQFYIGTSQGRHIKFYSDTESFVRINYDFISPYAKSILKIEADPYKNTENILICYNTARNQARILNENIKITGASTLAAQYDTIANLEAEINAIDSDVHSNYQSILILNSDVSSLEGYVKQGTIISIDQLNTIRNSGLYTIYTGNDESILPIARVPDENVVIQHINPWGSGSYGYAITQIIHYTSQNRSFIRYRVKMSQQPSSSTPQFWSDWSEILVTNNTDNFLENRLLVTGDNKQIENYDINPKDIITQKNSNLISDELNTIITDAEDIFINGGSFYDSRSISGTSWPSVSGNLSSCTLSSNSILTDSNLYLFSKSAVDTGTITLPEAIQNDFISYDQELEFKFHFGFILDYDSSGASQIEVLRAFDSFVMHMNSNSSVRIVATTQMNGTDLKISDWLSSAGLCAIAIDGSNSGEITLAVQPLYEDYTKKGTLISDTITLSSTDKLFCSSNINNVINLRANMNLSCFFIETGTSISSLTASELIDKMLEMRTLKSSPIATQDYVDAKTAGIPYCTCSTSASVSAKIVNNAPNNFVLEQGVRILVNFTNSNSIATPTLNVNGTGAKYIKAYSTIAPLTYAWHADAFIEFVYDGTYWVLMNREPASTAYAGIVKLNTSTSSTSTTTAATSSAVKALKDQLDDMTNLTLSTDLSYEAIS